MSKFWQESLLSNFPGGAKKEVFSGVGPTLWSWARTSGLEWSKLVLITFLASSKTPCDEVNICSLEILEFCLNSYDCVIYCITLLFSCLRISGQSLCLSGCMCLGLWWSDRAGCYNLNLKEVKRWFFFLFFLFLFFPVRLFAKLLKQP